jgi:hypothetical protein
VTRRTPPRQTVKAIDKAASAVTDQQAAPNLQTAAHEFGIEFYALRKQIVVDTCTCPECSYQLEPDEINRLVATATDSSHFDRLVDEALRDHRANDCVPPL